MSARSYILDTRAVQRNSPLVVASILTSSVKRYLRETVEREDLAEAVTSVNSFVGNAIAVVTGKPIINFELRAYEGGLRDTIKKVLAQHGLSTDVFITYK